MREMMLFLSGVGMAGGVSLAVVLYLKPHLTGLLVDLCGTAGRARFWAAFSNVTLLLIPLIFALHYHPGSSPQTPVIFELGTQLEWALIGLVVSVVTLGIVLSLFIPRQPPASEPVQGKRPT